MRNLYISCIIMLLAYANSKGQCIENGGFESGLAGYTFTMRSQQFNIPDCNVDTSDPTFTSFTPSPTANQFNNEGGTLVSFTGYDPTLLSATPAVSLPKVHSGAYAFKLNRSTGNSHISTMSRNITASSNSISFFYSLIVQSPHPGTPNAQPFFSARVYNSIGQIINTNEICIKADAANPIFTYADLLPAGASNTDAYYTGWQCALLTIPDEYIGQTVRIEFIITDCGYVEHFGTVYIDDITCGSSCSAPAMGYIDLNQHGFSCPTTPFEVCGTYIAPENSGLQSLELSIIDSNGIVALTIPTTSSLTGNEFCFTVDPSLFGTGEYEFRVDAVFDSATTTYEFELFDQSAVPGPDLTFLPVNIATTSYVSGNILHWEDVSDSYELEFITDGACCPGGDPGHSNYYSVTVNDNFIDLLSVESYMQSKCFRWRIKSDCGWSGWCCLAEATGDIVFPNDADFGNPLAPQCYEDGLGCAECPTIISTVTSGTFFFEQADECIIGENKVDANAKAIYIAEEYILLQPSFLADSGSSFYATIEDCTVEDVSPPSNLRKIVNNNNAENGEILAVADGFKTYPNPTSGTISISAKNHVIQYTITDLTGKTLLTIDGNNSEITEIDLSLLSRGIYLLSADGIPVQKIIRN